MNNSRSGGAWTWTAGARFTPNIMEDMITFRGNFTRSIRSPAVTELFLPTSAIFTRAEDPCDASNIDAEGKTNRRANCDAAALAAGADPSIFDGGGFQSNVVNGTAEGEQVGNPNLENEVADSYTLGVVIEPPFVPGLTLSVDYVNVSISNAISNLDGTAVMEACFDDESFGNDFCDKITRDSDFQVTFLKTGFANAGFQKFQAVTANLDYNFDINETFSEGNADWGFMSISGTYFRLIQDDVSITGSDLSLQDGEIGRSRDRGQLNINYNISDFNFLWQTRYIGSAVFNNNDDETSKDILGIGSYWNFNASVTYQVTENLEARLNVNNVFDGREPLNAGASGTSRSVYDFFGRYYRFGLKARF